jgi:hypothetical protein
MPSVYTMLKSHDPGIQYERSRIARLHRAKRNVRVRRRAPLAVVGEPHGALARLDKLVSKRETYAIACPSYRPVAKDAWCRSQPKPCR